MSVLKSASVITAVPKAFNLPCITRLALEAPEDVMPTSSAVVTYNAVSRYLAVFISSELFTAIYLVSVSYTHLRAHET